MRVCTGCATEGHSPEACANQDLPMCARMCACRHGAPESNPAPCWTAATTAATENEADR